MNQWLPSNIIRQECSRDKKQQQFKSMVLLFVLLCCFATSPMVSQLKAQQAVVTLDRSQILIGEQVTLQLKVENITSEAQKLSSWFKLPKDAHIEVVRKDKMDTISIEGQTTYMQKITITSFDSGKWVIPVTNPQIKDVNGQQYSLQPDAVSLEVMPVDVSQLKDFHPEKDIIAVNYTNYTWLYIVISILILAALIWLIYRYLRKRRNEPKKNAKVIKGPPMQWALSQIDLLVAEKLLEKGETKSFYTRLLDICRTYFDERIKSHTFQSTSQEMIDKLQNYLQKQKDRAALQDFTQLSDHVKFAEHLPKEDQTRSAVEIAKETIRNIEKQVLEANKKNDH